MSMNIKHEAKFSLSVEKIKMFDRTIPEQSCLVIIILSP